MENTLYFKDGQIVEQETGKTVALLPYFDAEDIKQQELGQLLATAPELYKALQILVSKIDTHWGLICSGTQNGTKTALLAEATEALSNLKY